MCYDKVNSYLNMKEMVGKNMYRQTQEKEEV